MGGKGFVRPVVAFAVLLWFPVITSGCRCSSTEFDDLPCDSTEVRDFCGSADCKAIYETWRFEKPAAATAAAGFARTVSRSARHVA